MSLDGFLTFFGLLIAGYAVLDPITRLKLHINAPIQILLIFFALIVILPFQFIKPILHILPPEYKEWISNLGFGNPKDPLNNSHIAFIATFLWAILAWVTFSFGRPRSRKLKRLLSLVERLHDENRYFEMLELVEPFLPVLRDNIRRTAFGARSYDWIAYASEKQTAADEYLDGSNGKFRWRSPKLIRWIFVLFRWMHPSFQRETYNARLIIDILAKSQGVRDTLQTTKPKFAASVFTDFHENHYDWSDIYLTESMVNKDSHLRQDIKRTLNYNRNQYYFSDESVLLEALVGQAKFATKIGVWKPVGDAVTKAIKEDKAYQTRLHEAPPQDDIDLFDDITYSAIHFFDILVRQAATQEHMDHMYLMYLQYFVQDLADLPKNTTHLENRSSEGADIKEVLILRALSILANWVELDKNLPASNSHSLPNTETAAYDASAIPYWAAQTLCRALRTIVFSEKFDETFKASCLNNFIRIGARYLSNDSYLRSYLAKGLIEGTTGVHERNACEKISALKYKLDRTHLFEFHELQERLS